MNKIHKTVLFFKGWLPLHSVFVSIYFCSHLVFTHIKEKLFSLTRGKETKCKGVVEEVDVHFCSENSSDKLELGDKDEEADEEGKECFWAKDFAPHHLCKKERIVRVMRFQNMFGYMGL